MIVEKTHIHILKIRVTAEQQLFQIKLPKNAKKIIGILVTVQPANVQTTGQGGIGGGGDEGQGQRDPGDPVDPLEQHT